MKNLIILLSLIASISTAKSATITVNEFCYYGIYNQDNNQLLLEGDDESYLRSIEHEYQTEEVSTTIEITSCENEEIESN